jgi:hypothetical protein
MESPLSLVLPAPRSPAGLMTCLAVRCPHGQRAPLVTGGPPGWGPQRAWCLNPPWTTGRWLLAERDLGRRPAVPAQRSARRRHARGGRETARVLRSSTDPGLRDRRKTAVAREAGPPACRRTPPPAAMAGASARAGAAAERDARGAGGGHNGPGAGCGRRSSRTRGRAGRRAVGAAQTTGCGRAKRGGRPAGPRAWIRLSGGRPPAMAPPPGLGRANGPRSKARARL